MSSPKPIPIHAFFAALIVTFFTIPALASSPELHNILPVAGQRGTQVEVSFYGQRLQDASSLLFYGEGITAGEIVVIANNQIRVVLTLAEDAALGEHTMRIVTRSGVTAMRTFHVTALPIQHEKDDGDENNNLFESPQQIEMNRTVLGRVRNEDVDYFVVDAVKGQRLTAEVHAMRLGRSMTDLYVAIMNEARFELAASDDSSLLLQDPVASLIVPEDGRYIIMLRDSAYRGGDNFRYAMHIGSFPRPTMVFPLGGQPGETLSVRLIGDVAGELIQEVTLPPNEDNDYGIIAQQDGQQSPSANHFRVNNLTNITEDPAADNNHWRQLEEAPAAALPAAFNGIIESAGDHDWYKIEAQQGQKFDIRMYARTLRSSLDAVVNIFKADGSHIQGNDDQGGPDSYFQFTMPEDGIYFLRVRDHLDRGGEEFAYRLEVTRVEPGLRVYPHRNDRNDPQLRQALAVPQGNRAAILMRVERINLGGDVELTSDALPEGVTLSTRGWPNGTDQAVVVIEADAEAPLGFRLVEMIGTRHRENASSIIGDFNYSVPLVLGNPNRTEYYHTPLDRLPVAVTEPVGFRIVAIEPLSPLVREGKKRLRVVIERDEGYDQVVNLHMLWNPPGISSTGRVDIAGDQTEGIFELSANGNAPTQAWPIAIHGHGPAGDGHAWVSSQLFTLTVEEPFVRGTIEMAATEQGKDVQLIVKLEHLRQWEGEAELRLIGIPAHASAEPLMITHGQEQAVFAVTVGEETPVNQHRGLICEITLTIQGEPVVARVAAEGVLRVDRPRPQVVEAPPVQEAAPNAPAPPAPPQLSRLEQLRRDAQQQREQGNTNEQRQENDPDE